MGKHHLLEQRIGSFFCCLQKPDRQPDACLALTNDAMKVKTIVAAVFTAICWISLCLDWDLLMYLTGFIALVLIGLDDLNNHFRDITKMISKINAMRSIRKEVVKA